MFELLQKGTPVIGTTARSFPLSTGWALSAGYADFFLVSVIGWTGSYYKSVFSRISFEKKSNPNEALGLINS